jgi:hypothetical protein
MVKPGGLYQIPDFHIEVDSIDLVPFSSIGHEDLHQSGEDDRESLRRRATQAGPIDDNTLLYRIEFHVVP